MNLLELLLNSSLAYIFLLNYEINIIEQKFLNNPFIYILLYIKNISIQKHLYLKYI
jgi:hypothetical protein